MISKISKVARGFNFGYMSKFGFASNVEPFYIQQFNTQCLAEFAYYIESNKEAVIIDPLRDIQPYLDLAKSRGAKIKYILETHFHADFVSGHLDLAKATGAQIVYGPTAQPSYSIKVAKDNEEIPLGEVSIKAIHTPGHTMESTCYVLLDKEKKPHSVYTGDTLFLGEVGRPDLAVKGELKVEDLSNMLYDSLRNKIMKLPDQTIVYPGHGAGSGCGKNICSGSSCTIGEQKAKNYALQDMSKDDFLKAMITDLAPPPQYYFHDAVMNKKGPKLFEDVMKDSLKGLNFSQFTKAQNEGALIIDARDQKNIHAEGYIPGSVAVTLALPFAVWVGTLIKPKTKIILITDSGKETEAVTRLARVGYEDCLGYLEGGFNAWVKNGGKVEKMDAIEPSEWLKSYPNKAGEYVFIDIRKPSEWRQTGIYHKTDKMLPLDQLPRRMDELDKNKTYHLVCGAGVRAVVAYTILKNHGFKNLLVMHGGAPKLKKEGGMFVDYTQ